MILLSLNALACFVVAYVALSYFLMRGEPHDLWGLMLQLGLVGLAACMAATPIALYQQGETPTWWAVGQRGASAVIAGCFYRWRFGFRRQWVELVAWGQKMLDNCHACVRLIQKVRSRPQIDKRAPR
jgi:hypothetical protein